MSKQRPRKTVEFGEDEQQQLPQEPQMAEMTAPQRFLLLDAEEVYHVCCELLFGHDSDYEITLEQAESRLNLLCLRKYLEDYCPQTTSWLTDP